MYQYIYFDLDDTLIRDNPRTGNSEIVQVGQDRYLKLRKTYKTAMFVLFTNRQRNQIRFPNTFAFDEIVGRDDMEIFVLDKLGRIPIKDFLTPIKILKYLWGLYLFKIKKEPKVLYLFFRHTVKDEKIKVTDDDKRVENAFKL